MKIAQLKIELGLVALAVSAAMIRPSEPVFDVEALIRLMLHLHRPRPRIKTVQPTHWACAAARITSACTVA
jgi:hypothetical protein